MKKDKVMRVTSLLPDTWRRHDLHKKFKKNLEPYKVRIGLFKYETSGSVCSHVAVIKIPCGIDKDDERVITSRNRASTMASYYLCQKETMDIIRSTQL
eukprot:9855895-Ditylum_brightwellii.AAC.1